MSSPAVTLNDLYVDVYPASWFAVLPSRALRRNQRVAVAAFGERLVAWRSASGAAHVQQRFCPHMGASLACGEVAGEHIVCPFHRWEYDAAGACKSIPYMEIERIPGRARLQTYPVVEQLGWIWAFNGDEPTHALPPLPEYGAKGFGVRQKSQVFDAHPLCILENGCDVQHFKYIHKVDFKGHDVKIVRDEPHGLAFDVFQYEVGSAMRGPRIVSGTVLTSIAYVGASLIYGRSHLNDRLLFSFVAAPTPIGPNRTRFTLIVAVKNLPGILSVLNPVYRGLVARQAFKGATDDYIPVWKEMDGSYRGVLVEEDRLQQRFRRYYHSHLALARDIAPLRRSGTEVAIGPS
jgi:phenylpropionate dioxygenase-like ring-hydroxylating dioxygenase large terminal subunit